MITEKYARQQLRAVTVEAESSNNIDGLSSQSLPPRLKRPTNAHRFIWKGTMAGALSIDDPPYSRLFVVVGRNTSVSVARERVAMACWRPPQRAVALPTCRLSISERCSVAWATLAS